MRTVASSQSLYLKVCDSNCMYCWAENFIMQKYFGHPYVKTYESVLLTGLIMALSANYFAAAITYEALKVTEIDTMFVKDFYCSCRQIEFISHSI